MFVVLVLGIPGYHTFEIRTGIVLQRLSWKILCSRIFQRGKENNLDFLEIFMDFLYLLDFFTNSTTHSLPVES